jgi:plastocyanin
MSRLILPIALLALAVALPGGATGSTAKTKTVKVGDDFYSPTKVTIHVNDIVKWDWGTGTDNEHQVIDVNSDWMSKKKTSGTFKHRFKKSGTFKVTCSEHPDDMKLTVKVKKPS